MELEQQVCSLELSKKLKELGVKQESYFWYGESTGNCIWTQDKELILNPISAFTVAELGEILPEYFGEIGINTRLEFLTFQKVGLWEVGYDGNEVEVSCEDKLLVNACAKMLIYLLENKLVTPEGSK